MYSMCHYLVLFVYEIFLLLTCILGDYFITHFYFLTNDNIHNTSNEISKQRILWTRALADNITHGMVGLLSWAIVVTFNCKFQQFQYLILSFVLASGVDMDHFIAARSTHIEDAFQLPTRPQFHNSTVIIFVSGISWLIGYYASSRSLKIFSLLFLTSWLSHHIRDATRRGLWFGPIGSTPAIPYKLYICMILVLPLLVRFVYNYSLTENNKAASFENV